MLSGSANGSDLDGRPQHHLQYFRAKPLSVATCLRRTRFAQKRPPFCTAAGRHRRSASAVGVGTAFGIGRRGKIAGNHFGQLLIGAGLLVETESFPYLGSAKRIAL